MSMYAVNTSVPKSLVRYLVQYYADTTDDNDLRAAFLTDRKSDQWPFRPEAILGCHLMPV